MTPTIDEITQAIRLARRVKAMRGKDMSHSCGDLYCYDPDHLVVAKAEGAR